MGWQRLPVVVKCLHSLKLANAIHIVKQLLIVILSSCYILAEIFNVKSKMSQEIRVRNLRKLISEFGSQAKLADAVGCTPSVISQLITGHRDLGEKLARKIEEGAGKPLLWLDGEVQANAEVELPGSAEDEILIQKLRQLGGSGQRAVELMIDEMLDRTKE